MSTLSGSKSPPIRHGLPGWGSIRGRYLYIAAAFSLMLVAAAWVADRQVQEASGRNHVNASQRQAARLTLRALADDVWQAETALQTFLLVPAAQTRQEVETSLNHALAELDAQLAADSEPIDERYRTSLERLRDLLAALKAESGHVMDLRTAPERLFPAMPIVLERMAPQQTTFNTAAGLALSELETDLAKPGNAELYRLFADARYASAQMIGAFRVWVANRFGIFGNSETAMAAQASNIRKHAERIDSRLRALEAIDRRGALDLPLSLSLQQMRKAHREWLSQYRQAAAIFTSERWRSDTPLMRDTILPLFARTWSSLRDTESSIEGRSTEDLSSLARVADALSHAIWLLTAIALAVAALGYLLFEFSVRRPIARVAEVLKAEAAGGSEAPPAAATREIRDLIAAFDDMRRQVRSRQQRLETILDHAAEGIITFDANGRIERFNRAAERLFGYAEGEIVGHDIGALLVPPERRRDYVEHFMRTEIQRLIGREGEVTGWHKDGSTFAMALKISRMELDGRVLYTGLVADISERKAMVEHLKNMAEHDGLTGLYNRTYFQQELERVVERAQCTGSPSCALLYLDLDNFKYVNDTLGHAAGDRLLLEVAGILHKRARKSDLIARFGGDEFTVLLYGTTPALALKVAESFRRRLADYRFLHEGKRIDIGCSIGIAAIDQQTTSAEEALSRADLACHLAKRNGRNQVHTYRASDAENVAAMAIDMGLSRRIREAIAHDRFALACQPILHTRSRTIAAYEVLIRLQDESDQIIMPSGFLAAAARFGLAADIDRWVINHAIDMLARERRQAPGVGYSINLSGQTLSQPPVCDLIEEKLHQSGLDPTALTFEVTETVAIGDMTVARAFLSRLRQMGCRTALDDFGSGMSSFAYLRDLPVDFVKIDGRFVRNLAVNEVDQAMVKAIAEIVHALGKQVIAEFVEDEASFRLLAEYGVDFAQGYHLGRPEVTLPSKAAARSAGRGGKRVGNA